MKPPNIKLMAQHFTTNNFLPLSFGVNVVKIEDAMNLAAVETARYYNAQIEKLRDEIQELRVNGDKPNK